MSLKRQRESDDETQTEESEQAKVLNVEVDDSSPAQEQDKPKRKPKQKSKVDTSITCSLPPLCSQEPQTFSTWRQYESHYISSHTNTCTECKKNFPTSRLLDLHITENHDPFTRIKLQKGDHVFGCFVEGCDRMFRDHKKRRLHLIDKHDYPKDFIFSIVDRGIKKNDTSLIKKDTKSYGMWKPA